MTTDTQLSKKEEGNNALQEQALKELQEMCEKAFCYMLQYRNIKLGKLEENYRGIRITKKRP